MITVLPDVEIMTIEWPVEMLRQTDERIIFSDTFGERSQTTFELAVTTVDRASNAIAFDLIEATVGVCAGFRFSLGGADKFKVVQTSDKKITVTIGKLRMPLDEYFSSYPPLFRFVDLSELDANLHIVPQTPYDLTISEDRFEPWSWKGVDVSKESIWKDGKERNDSIQWHAARHYIDANFDVVFDDDASGEAADLVCIKEEEKTIRVALVQCKFSGGAEGSERVKDVVDVSSQAVRSAR